MYPTAVPSFYHFASTAARKAWEALRDGRLPASPRAWLRDLKLHWGELAERPPATPRAGEGKRALEARLGREWRRFLDGGERLRLPTSADPVLSILIVAYRRDELLLRCLRALVTAVPFEVILVDNARSLLLDRVDGAEILRNDNNRGFPAAVNQAARRARGRHLLLLNHDAAPHPGAIEAALSALTDDVGAVGARLILPDGRLQEAGSTVRRDGSCEGLGRGQDPDDPRFLYQRDVDFCSGAFLMTPRALFEELAGLDESYGPAYYEEVDYCVRLWKRGRRVVYCPAATVDHFEFASAPSPGEAMRMQAERRARFAAAHTDFLAGQPQRGRWQRRRGLHILVFDDRVPHAHLGSGFPRALAMLQVLADAGHQVTLYPTSFPDDDFRADLSPTVEVVGRRGWPEVRRFWHERRREFDRVLVSRPGNLRMLRARLTDWPPPHLIYDAEALFALREGGSPAEEVAEVRGARAVLAVSAAEAAHFSPLCPTHVVGHALTPAATKSPFAGRRGLLFVGAFYAEGSPNSEAVLWFARELLPRIRARLGEVPFTVVGARPPPAIRSLSGIELRERVDDLTPLYDAARLFVAPTLRAAGLPYKVHHAAAHGLPVVCTPLLAGQLGWSSEVRAAGAGDFAEAVCDLYQDAAAWQAQREAALRRVAADCSPETFRRTLLEALR
jgi:GT2 family glycosyltransferase